MKELLTEKRILHFLSKISIPNDRNACWEWKDACSSNGYGNYRLGKKKVRPHRVSYWIFKGEIPEGMLICHQCDNKICVNPDHLFLGSPKENMKDMVAKGRNRTRHGESHWWAKLKDSDIPKIVQLRHEGWPQADIAERFSVSPSRITQILHDPRYANFPKRTVRIARKSINPKE